MFYATKIMLINFATRLQACANFSIYGARPLLMVFKSFSVHDLNTGHVRYSDPNLPSRL